VVAGHLVIREQGVQWSDAPMKGCSGRRCGRLGRTCLVELGTEPRIAAVSLVGWPGNLSVQLVQNRIVYNIDTSYMIIVSKIASHFVRI